MGTTHPENIARHVPGTVVELSGDIAPDLAEYAREKIGTVLGHTGRDVLRARVRVLRHRDPARQRPVVARADVDLAGRPVRVHVEATRPREAVDLLADRLDHRLERAVRPIRRPRRAATIRRPDRAEREIVRRSPLCARRCSVEEAAAEMDDLGYDFHLFTDVTSGQDAVVYRAGPTGLRLALAGGAAGPYGPSVTVSPAPAAVLDAAAAAERLELSGLPFLFYVDAGHGRAGLLHHRHDGHFGLVGPASP